ncbi:MAG: hypothetical protein C0482_01295 [Gordonia sp.]|nr:hypothetical protein [Gordonia sp. (in: high G+C Gram-positive bacteria)]
MRLCGLSCARAFPKVQTDPVRTRRSALTTTGVNPQKGAIMTLDSMRTRTDLGPTVAFHPAKWSFAIAVEPVTDRHALVRVRGDVDMVTAPRLLAGINEAISDHTDVTVDLSDVNFFSCAAAEIVLAAYARRPEGFRILAPSRAARRVLDLFADDRLIYDIGVDAAAVH